MKIDWSGVDVATRATIEGIALAVGIGAIVAGSAFSVWVLFF